MAQLTEYQQHVITLHVQADDLFRRARELLVKGEQLQAVARYLELTNSPKLG